MLTRAVAAVLRCAVRVFFRRIEIVGAERIPRDVPLLLVANHVNGIVDPLLIGLLGLQVRFLAKSTLWAHPLIGPVLRLTGAIPVFRRQDPGVDTGRNGESFERCHAALAAGEVIALFPEGKSHSEVGLAPLKTGAARIALEAEARYGPLGARIVPVGLTFDAKALFRSRVLVRIGEPIDPAAERSLHGLDPWAAVLQLTQRIHAGLTAVTLSYASSEEALLLEHAADVYATARQPAASMAEHFAVRQAFIAGSRDLVARAPEQVAAVTAAIRHYDALRCSLALGAVTTADPDPSAQHATGRGLWRGLLRLCGGFPVAALGSAVNWLPYRAIGALAKRLAGESDVVATYKLLGGVVLFPLWWLSCAAVVAHYASLPVGLIAAPAAALCGYVALLFHERRAELWQRLRALILHRSRGALAGELAARRSALIDAVDRAHRAMSSPYVQQGGRGVAEPALGTSIRSVPTPGSAGSTSVPAGA